MLVDVDIIILSYLDDKPLARCIQCINQHCKDFNLILIDNNVTNKGWSLGNNFGASQGTSEYIWFLNSDAYCQHNTLHALLDRFRDDRCGAAASQQLDPMNPNLIRYGGSLSFYPYGQHRGGLVNMGNCDIPSRQVWLNGASLLVKRDLFEALKGFNENLFMYYGDSDFSLRVRRAGYDLWYEPESKVLHRLGSSASADGIDRDKKAFEKYWGIQPTETGFVSSLEFKELLQL